MGQVRNIWPIFFSKLILLSSVMFQEKFTSNESFDRKNKYKTNDQSCPKGTVAILRQRSETESLHLDTVDQFGHHVYPSFPVL